jgi:hypothetical protein
VIIYNNKIIYQANPCFSSSVELLLPLRLVRASRNKGQLTTQMIHFCILYFFILYICILFLLPGSIAPTFSLFEKLKGKVPIHIDIMSEIAHFILYIFFYSFKFTNGIMLIFYVCAISKNSVDPD